MGNILRAKCDNCGYTDDFNIGGGILFCELDFVKKQFEESIQAEIEAWSVKHSRNGAPRERLPA